LTPDFWGKHKIDDHPFESFSKSLSMPQEVTEQRAEDRNDRPQRRSRNY